MNFRRALTWTTVSQVAFFLLQFGGSVVLSRLLTLHDMGVYAAAGAIIGVIWLLQAFGLNGLIVREHDLPREVIATVFTVNTAINLVIAAGLAGLGLFGGGFIHTPGVLQVLAGTSILPLLSSFEFMPAAMLERHGQFRALAVIGTSRNVVSTAVTLGLAFAGYSYMSFVYANLVGTVVSATVANILARRHRTVGVGLSEWRRVLGFGAQLMGVSLVNSISARISDLSLGRLQGLAPLGLYNRAASLNGILWDNIHLVVGRVLFVDFAQVKREGRSLRERYLLTLEVMTAVLWPAFTGFAVLVGPFILTVYGAKWTGAAEPMIFLAAASIVQVSITMTWEVFVVSDNLKAQTRIEFIRTPVGLALFVGGCCVSITAAAAARLLDAVFSMLLYRPHLERMTQTRLSDALPIYARSALLTGLAVAPAAALMTAYGRSPATPLVYVLGSVAGGMALWAGGLAALRHPLIDEALRLLHRLRSREEVAPAPVTPAEVAVLSSEAFKQPAEML